MAKKKTTSHPVADISGFPLVRTALLFCLLVLSFHLAQWVLVPESAIKSFEELTASAVAELIAIAGIPCILDGTRISLPTSQWEIVLECTALTAMVVFVSFIVAFPASLRSKACAIGAGVPLLFVANILRLVTLAWFTLKVPKLTGCLHDYVWNVVFLFLVVLMWLAWLSLVVKRERAHQVSC